MTTTLSRRAVLAAPLAFAAPIPSWATIAGPDPFTVLLERRAALIARWRDDPRDLIDAEVQIFYGNPMIAIEDAMADHPPHTHAGAVAALDFLLSEASNTVGGAPLGEPSQWGGRLFDMLQAARDVLAGGAS